MDIQTYCSMYNSEFSQWDIDLLIAMQKTKQYSQQKRNK